MKQSSIFYVVLWSMEHVVVGTILHLHVG
jgi:hypothetical protein